MVSSAVAFQMKGLESPFQSSAREMTSWPGSMPGSPGGAAIGPSLIAPSSSPHLLAGLRSEN